MPDIETVVKELAAIEAVKRLKHKYWRLIDQFGGSEIGDVFTEKASCDYGQYGTIEGRDKIVEFFLTRVYPSYTMMVHRGANPEIDLVDDTTARAMWSYESYMLARHPRKGFWHCGYYQDEYRIEGGAWKISYTKGTYYFNCEVDDYWAGERSVSWPPTPPSGAAFRTPGSAYIRGRANE